MFSIAITFALSVFLTACYEDLLDWLDRKHANKPVVDDEKDGWNP
jgi:type III secretory pathway lipoprotein EscJ